MDTTNRHIGNVLDEMSDEDMREVLEQYMKKRRFLDKESLIKHFRDILECHHFDYDGNMDKINLEENDD
jgi:hypothetical protein